MKIFWQRMIIYLVTVPLLLAVQVAHGKKMIRWEDEQGNIFYSDLVPPEHAKHRRESLNKDARVIDVIEQAKTKQQRELEKRLKALRKEQQKIIAKQMSWDKILLTNYRSLTDMRQAQTGQLLRLSDLRKVSLRKLQGLEKQLEAQQKQAAEHERNGQKVPEKLVNEIQTTEKQIRLVDVEINNHKQRRKQLEKAFAADVERFKFLNQSERNAKKLSTKTAAQKAADELGLFDCVSAAQCSKAWKMARQFVKQYSTTRIDVDSDKLILGSLPISDDDLSLSVSLMTRNNKAPEIFLDIRCRETSLGKELCVSHKARNIRSAFRPYIQSALGMID